jgi:hypothetical protein
MPIRVCFMVMPFGTKSTGVESGKGPGQIDFNALWEKAFRPMIESLGYLPVRADQDLGALIIQEMIERLTMADLVIADLTIPNGNVYYEVGVRHAARKHGCVMIAADWSKQLFDVDQMRRVAYPLTEGSITDETAAAIQQGLIKRIKSSIDGVSPVFQAVPGYPADIDPTKLGTFREVAEKLASFQAEVSVIRRLPVERAPAESKKLLSRYREDANALPSIALELTALLRDAREWTVALNFLDGLPDRVKQFPVVREQRALLRGKSGQQLQAIAELETLIEMEGDNSERRGLVGGRYKVLHEEAKDAQSKATYLNYAISNYERGMMLDLNDYYPSCNLPRLYRERREKDDERKAVEVATVAKLACERSRKRNPDDPWITLTLLAASFDAGDVRSARELCAEISRGGAPALHVESTILDLRRSLYRLRDSKKAARLAAVLGDLQRLLDPSGVIIALAGRRVDLTGPGDSHFPSVNVSIVAQRIRNMLIGTGSKVLVCSAACGADILALEAAAALGIRRYVVLPFNRDRFRETSVVDRGSDWGNRFDAVVGGGDIEVLELDSNGDDIGSYSAASAKILDIATQLAAPTRQRVIAAVVWNGFSRGTDDLTDGFQRDAQARKLELITVPTL